jgi:hypothetical protein
MQKLAQGGASPTIELAFGQQQRPGHAPRRSACRRNTWAFRPRRRMNRRAGTPMPTNGVEGNFAAKTAAPQPPNTSQNVPRNSAARRFDMGIGLISHFFADPPNAYLHASRDASRISPLPVEAADAPDSCRCLERGDKRWKRPAAGGIPSCSASSFSAEKTHGLLGHGRVTQGNERKQPKVPVGLVGVHLDRYLRWHMHSATTYYFASIRPACVDFAPRFFKPNRPKGQVRPQRCCGRQPRLEILYEASPFPATVRAPLFGDKRISNALDPARVDSRGNSSAVMRGGGSF